jgi:hypothetical protein
MAVLGIPHGDEHLDVLMTLGRHEEFTLFASVALLSSARHKGRADKDTALWELAQQVTGWGRIHVVECLAGTPDEAIRAWMLRDGYRNSIMYEYLAHVCATTGGLLGALRDPCPDDALLRGAGDIIEALLIGGPAQDMDDYDDGAEAVMAYTERIRDWPSAGMEEFLALRRIARYVEDEKADWTARGRGWSDEIRGRIAANARAVTGRPQWAERAVASMQAEDDTVFWNAAEVAEALGIDTWETRYERQRAGREQWYFLAKTRDAARMDRLLSLARAELDLAAVASGPDMEPGFGPAFAAHRALDSLLSGLGAFPGKGPDLILAGLCSPVVRNRNLAVRALSQWGQSNWPPEARAALTAALAAEPDDSARRRMANVLAGRPPE